MGKRNQYSRSSFPQIMTITGSIVTIRQSAAFASSSVNTSGSSGSLPDLVASGSTGSYVTVPTSDDLYILWVSNSAGSGSAVSASINIDSMSRGQVITICLPIRNNVPNVHLQDPTATSSSSGITNAILGGLGGTEAVGSFGQGMILQPSINRTYTFAKFEGPTNIEGTIYFNFLGEISRTVQAPMPE